MTRTSCQVFTPRKLYGESKSGKIKEWGTQVNQFNDGTAVISTDAGYVHGKIKVSPKTIRKGKNIGRSNETTPFQQACSEVVSEWNKKKDGNYEEDITLFDPQPRYKNTDAMMEGIVAHLTVGPKYQPRLMLPQLAQSVKKGKIKFPAYIQPKLNGICDLTELRREWPNIKISLHHSRGGKLFHTLEHMDEWLDDLYGRMNQLDKHKILHGELYVHGWSLQKLSSYSKKVQPDQHKLELHVYDLANLDRTFEDRWGDFADALSHMSQDCPIKAVPTVTVEGYEDAKWWHDKWVQEGYEGAVLKNLDGKYAFQFRSDDIEKVKSYKNAEFMIIGGKEGVGKAEGCVTYLLQTSHGMEFEAVPRGTIEDRQAMWKNLPNDIGKMMTIRFAEYSDDGVPLQATGLPEAEAVRDYE